MSERYRSTSIEILHDSSSYGLLFYFRSDVGKCKGMQAYYFGSVVFHHYSIMGLSRILDFINLFSQKSLNNAMHILKATIMLIVCMYHAKNVHLGHRVSTSAHCSVQASVMLSLTM
jgi:hypothetical protein